VKFFALVPLYINTTIRTSGVKFDSKPIAVLLPPQATHIVKIVGVPSESGKLVVKGCSTLLPGCDPVDIDFEQNNKRQRMSLAMEASRTKYSGLASRQWEKDLRLQAFANIQDSSSPSVQSALTFNVVSPQPLLRIKRTSLSHGALMIYEGER
jgi:hypothetical protein